MENTKQKGFEFEGVWIENPTISPCGRFGLSYKEAKRIYGDAIHNHHEFITTSDSTNDLLLAFSDFLACNGLEALADISAEEMLYQISADLEEGEETPQSAWLVRFIRLWAFACDEEYAHGHEIDPLHGWHKDLEAPII